MCIEPPVSLATGNIRQFLILAWIALAWLSLFAHAYTEQELKEYASHFPEMPNETVDLTTPENPIPSFGSGTPFCDLEYTLYDSDYIDGENGGYDIFMPVKPSEPLPGSGKIKYIRCALNTDLGYVYNVIQGDRIILGAADCDVPFFLKDADEIDHDFAVIQHFDYAHGHIQLKGQPADYSLIYCTPQDGCNTEGWYLFYTKDGHLDLIAFIYPCWDLMPPISGKTPSYPDALCGFEGTLSLTNRNQFIYSEAIAETASVPSGIVQYGTNGKDIVGGLTVDHMGNIYLFGFTDGAMDSLSGGSYKIFVAKIDSSGIEQWVTALPMKEGSFLFDAVTDSDFIYVCGRTLGNLPGFSPAKRWDGILLKLSLATGQVEALDQWGNEGIDGYGNITLDPNGNLYLSGQGSPEGVNGTDDSYLVAKHRCLDLSNVWRVIEPTVEIGFAASAEAWGGITYVHSESPGLSRLVVAGWYMSIRGADAFVSVYENLGEPAPTRSHSIILYSPGQQADWILDNAVDSQGNIYVAGYTTGSLLGGTHQGEGDAFVIKYDPALSNPQVIQFGTPRSDMIRKLEIDADDNLYAVGYTYGSYASSNQDSLQRTGDFFVLKMNPSLVVYHTVQFGSPGEDRALTYLSRDMLYLGGTTEGAMVSRNKGTFDGFAMALETQTLSVHSFAQERTPDFNQDQKVDLIDYAYISQKWLFDNCGQCEGIDLTGDGEVDIKDLSVLAEYWLRETSKNGIF